jgi:hypothetical protein
MFLIALPIINICDLERTKTGHVAMTAKLRLSDPLNFDSGTIRSAGAFIALVLKVINPVSEALSDTCG